MPLAGSGVLRRPGPPTRRPPQPSRRVQARHRALLPHLDAPAISAGLSARGRVSLPPCSTNRPVTARRKRVRRTSSLRCCPARLARMALRLRGTPSPSRSRTAGVVRAMPAWTASLPLGRRAECDSVGDDGPPRSERRPWGMPGRAQLGGSASNGNGPARRHPSLSQPYNRVPSMDRSQGVKGTPSVTAPFAKSNCTAGARHASRPPARAHPRHAAQAARPARRAGQTSSGRQIVDRYIFHRVLMIGFITGSAGSEIARSRTRRSGRRRSTSSPPPSSFGRPSISAGRSKPCAPAPTSRRRTSRRSPRPGR